MNILYLKDLQGFESLGAFTSPLKGNYGIFAKDKFLALVHLEDEEVVLIINRKKREITYQCPKDRWNRPIIEKMVDALIDAIDRGERL